MKHSTTNQNLITLKDFAQQTKISISFIKKNLFNNPEFPKYRVGNKWLIHAGESEKYLITWLKSRSNEGHF